jgi:hypothetical protein
LLQSDLSIYDSLSIINSKKIIYQDSIVGSNGPRFLQNAPDGKIYINIGSVTDTILYSIDFPNNLGFSCGINFNGIDLSNKIARSGFPNFNESYFNQSSTNACTNLISEPHSDIVRIFPNPAQEWVSVNGEEINSLQLFNIYGKECIKETTTNSINNFNVSSLARGVYLLIINSQKNIITQTLILN